MVYIRKTIQHDLKIELLINVLDHKSERTIVTSCTWIIVVLINSMLSILLYYISISRVLAQLFFVLKVFNYK